MEIEEEPLQLIVAELFHRQEFCLAWEAGNNETYGVNQRKTGVK